LEKSLMASAPVPPTASPSAGSIPPTELAERLAQGQEITVLDIRAEVDAPIEGPGATSIHRPAERVLADPAASAAELRGPVVVVCNRGMTARGVAEVLRAHGVDATVLEGGMRGWLGALQAWQVETGVPGLDVIQVQRPGRGCLSYVLAAGGEALVVDPAPDADFYAGLAEGLGARVTAVLDTHVHADHLSGARSLASRTGAALRLPAASLERGVAFAEAVETIADGEEIALGPLGVRAISLPGHTTDMTGFLVAGRVLIAGDSLFADGIARPDLQRSGPDGALKMGRLLHATLHERVLPLEDDVVLLPCHTHPGVRAEAIAPRLGEVRATVPELAIADPGEFAAALIVDMPPRPANYEAVIAVNSGTHPFDPELEAGGNSCATR
jgi:glyoxylase-like metal-dependent hydrolase (beta-lactamase superfamily II)